MVDNHASLSVAAHSGLRSLNPNPTLPVQLACGAAAGQRVALRTTALREGEQGSKHGSLSAHRLLLAPQVAWTGPAIIHALHALPWATSRQNEKSKP